MYKRLEKFSKGIFDFSKQPKVGIINEKQKIEAEDAGLELISKTIEANSNLYKIKDCGHLQTIQPTHVRRNNYKCKTCNLFKQANSQIEVGSTLVYLDGNKKCVIKSCGHVAFGFVVGSSVNCNKCYLEKIEKTNYEIISESKGECSLRFKVCGHIKHKVKKQQLTRENVVCRDCKVLEDDAQAASMGLFRKSDFDNRYALYQLPCNHFKTLRVDHAADGSYLCDECGDSHYTKPSSVYLIKIQSKNKSWLKLGKARNIKNRISGYGLSDGVNFEILKSIDFQSGREALNFERMLHKFYKKFRLSSREMQKYMKNGKTECYPTSMLETLITELEVKCKNK